MKIDKISLLLEKDRICLRPVRVSDITEEYVNGLNDPEVNKYLVDVRRNTQTRESVESYVSYNLENPSDIFFGIFVNNNPKPFIGTVRAHNIDLFHYSADIGICLFAKRAWKKGFALQSLTMVKDYLFITHNLHYLEAGIYSKNIKSIKLFLRAGFTEQYRVKNKLRFENSFEEVIYFAAINPSFDMSLLT